MHFRIKDIFLDSGARWRLFAVAAGVLLVIVVLTSVHLAQGRGDDTPSASPPVAVEVVRAELREIRSSVAVTGTLAAYKSVNLVAKVSGEVAEILVEMGQEVEDQDHLIRLDDSDLLLQRDQARAALEAASAQVEQLAAGASAEEIQQLRAQLEVAEAQAEAAGSTLDRMEFLYEEGAVSLQELEGAQTQARIAEQQLVMAQQQVQRAEEGASPHALKAARAQVRQAEAALSVAESMLAASLIKAPFSGVVSYVSARQGEMASPGVPLVGVVVTDPVTLELGVTEGTVVHLEPGDELVISVPVLGTSHRGLVSQVAPAADPQTRVFPVKVVIPNPAGDLRPGMIAQARVVTGKTRAVAVPRQAVVSRGPESHAFVVEEGIARRREVETGLQDQEFVEILHGIDEGEVVVVRGAAYLYEGARVTKRWGE